MAKSPLKSCKACGTQISRHSPLCRKCGHPQGAPLVVWALILFVLLMLAFYVACMIHGILHPERHRALRELPSLSSPSLSGDWRPEGRASARSARRSRCSSVRGLVVAETGRGEPQVSEAG